MKKSDIYEIAIKIVGFYLVTVLLWQLRDIFNAILLEIQSQTNPKIFEGFDQTPMIIVTIIAYIVLGIITMLLLFKTKTIAKLICRPTDFEESVTLFAEKSTIYEIALTIVGLLLLVETFPDFAYKLKVYLQNIKNFYPQKESEAIFIATSSIKLVIGFLAIFYSNPIANFFSKKNKAE